MFHSQWKAGTQENAKVLSGLQWSLLKACPTIWRIIQKFDGAQDFEHQATALSSAMQASKQIIEKEMIALALTVRRDILKIVFDGRGLSTQVVDSMDMAAVDSELDKITTFTSCKLCSKRLIWSDVLNHACMTYDNGHEDYSSFVQKKRRRKRCTAAGWKPERLALDDGLAQSIYGLLSQRVKNAILPNGLVDPLGALPDEISVLRTSKWKFVCEMCRNARLYRVDTYMSPIDAVSLSLLLVQVPCSR